MTVSNSHTVRALLLSLLYEGKTTYRKRPIVMHYTGNYLACGNVFKTIQDVIEHIDLCS